MNSDASLLDELIGDQAEAIGCRRCREGEHYRVPVRMAFQPIVDVARGEVFAYEALVRGPNGEGAGQVIAAVPPQQLYSFDQTCRVAAIRTAVALGLDAHLSINFLPNAVYDPATCIRITLTAAERYGFPTDRLLFEMTESEQIRNPEHALSIVRDYKQRGFQTAIDDFGAGYSGLNLLAQFQPDIVKLDMALTRGIDTDKVRVAIVDGVIRTCTALGCKVVAEGIESAGEAVTLHRLGVDLFQGYWFAKPALEALPEVDMDAFRAAWAAAG